MKEIARSAGAWTESFFFERGWADHHDVALKRPVNQRYDTRTMVVY